MTRIALLVLALAAMPAGAAGVYKCTGADGKTYYSERRCPQNAEGERLQVPRPTVTEPDAQKQRGGKSLDERIAEATDPVVKARLQIQKQECELAETQLKRYEDAPYLIEKRADGTERQLSAEETQAEKDKLRREIETRCR